MIREEHNLPLTADAYQHLKEKIDGRLIVKDRYIIPLESDPDLLIELDFFKNELEDLILAEVEFPDKASADRFSSSCMVRGRCYVFFPLSQQHLTVFPLPENKHFVVLLYFASFRCIIIFILRKIAIIFTH